MLYDQFYFVWVLGCSIKGKIQSSVDLWCDLFCVITDGGLGRMCIECFRKALNGESNS